MNKLGAIALEAAQPDQVERKIVASLERRRLRAYILLLIIDAAALHGAFMLASRLYLGSWGEQEIILAAQALLPVYFTIALYNRTYSLRALADWVFALRQAVTALIISSALLAFLAFYTKSSAEFSRVSVTLGLLFFVVSIVAVRRCIPLFVDTFWEGRVRNELVIEDGGPQFGLEGAVSISAEKYNLDPSAHDPFMLDRLGKLLRNQDRVVVSTPSERRENWAFLLKSAGVQGEIVSEPAHRLGALGVHRYEDKGRTTLVVSTGPLGVRARITKRLFDVTAALGGLLVLAPLFAVIALLIKLEDGGPVLFIQRRLGRGNQFFDMYKFRSMRPEGRDLDGTRSTARGDERVTRIGDFIRKTSLDELPQLFNVLLGDMSIVGPRPHALGSRANNKYFWEVDGTYWQRHCLKPGLTGLAQVRGHRGATELEKDLTDRLQSDLEYIDGWSLRRDVEIVFKTLWVLQHDNAY
ncbi:MAG: sugar transferase [Erythrobacter sp.]|uniref:sugar transferase n=1 Tax=Erythrobacter sp. TaxID=1042 RepID=UPI002608A4D8|nr:sugar transferase [Erythrobacter sp.]MDJ0978314.1 sugar transferase [Erythrobacter sp.]